MSIMLFYCSIVIRLGSMLVATVSVVLFYYIRTTKVLSRF